MAIWRLITSDSNPPIPRETLSTPRKALEWYRNHHVIALGWGSIGDLRHFPLYQRDDIVPLVKTIYGHARGSAAGCLWDFWQEMQVDDLVILGLGGIEGGVRDCVVRITGDYFWDNSIPHGVPEYFDDYSHRRNIELTAENPDELWRGTRLAPGYDHRRTLNLRVLI